MLAIKREKGILKSGVVIITAYIAHEEREEKCECDHDNILTMKREKRRSVSDHDNMLTI